jgi:protocatechuate 3,4-dioxygenase, beta subunit
VSYAPPATRREFLAGLALSGAACVWAPGTFAEELVRTPRQTEGPFYPNRLPLDTDNDLLIINDAISPAVGEITHLTGRVLDEQGDPVRNAVVEIWQVDNNGVYLHSGSAGNSERDTNFQGFGRFLTDSTGKYYFRTIKPVPYGRGRFQRAPHIHLAVYRQRHPKFTTQCYIQGHPLNNRDGILQAIADPAARASVIVQFAPLEASPMGELAAHFDMVLGSTSSHTH